MDGSIATEAPQSRINNISGIHGGFREYKQIILKNLRQDVLKILENPIFITTNLSTVVRIDEKQFTVKGSLRNALEIVFNNLQNQNIIISIRGIYTFENWVRVALSDEDFRKKLPSTEIEESIFSPAEA